MNTKINDKFSLKSAPYCWVLTYHYMGVSIGGKPAKMQTDDTFHPNLLSICKNVLERTAKDCEALEDIPKAWDKAVLELTRVIEYVEASGK